MSNHDCSIRDLYEIGSDFKKNTGFDDNNLNTLNGYSNVSTYTILIERPLRSVPN